jgi:hypothetical protein
MADQYARPATIDDLKSVIRSLNEHASYIDLTPRVLDLGVTNYISNLQGGAQLDQFDTDNTAQILAAIDAALKAHADGWSVADAAQEASLLVNIVGSPTTLANEQAAALKDFLSLYALTQADGQTGLNGHIVNTTAANLFGGMVTRVHIGGEGSQNPYPSINAILKDLGITSSTEPAHQSHFHIYLKPPILQTIGGNHLLTDDTTASAFDLTAPAPLQSEAQGVISYTQTLIEGEELMFIMDVPSIPAQETPIVLAQAAAPAGSTPQPDYILQTCGETESTGDPRSAMHAVDPAGMIRNYMQGIYNRPVELSSITNITLLQNTSHGKITSVIDNTGRSWYRYDPTPNYVGNDKAVFQAEYEGKVYKIVLELRVFLMVNEYEPTCPQPKLIKVKKPSTGSSGYDLNSITVTFADLDGGAIGLTNTSGITLDDNAAGHNWFIDTTPSDNSEYLPTSNPYEWVAKEGTAAYGKMDMLSVLLHEYGHALGIEHSADNHDYMSTTLTPGVRRMPSAEELALM